ncbi:hypothetical protein GCM10010271_36080 [Streptomyces kurssanovii]|nr:hypothetical protein GCM10010271_36080 [Streptomyces kurssanovii]
MVNDDHIAVDFAPPQDLSGDLGAGMPPDGRSALGKQRKQDRHQAETAPPHQAETAPPYQGVGRFDIQPKHLS